jgi:hypothetical protein
MEQAKNICIYLIFYFLVSTSFGQTKSFGNYEVYSYEASRNGVGFLSTKINFPEYLNSYIFEQQGAIYTYQYYSNEIAKINFMNNFRLRFITEGNFNIGGGYSVNYIENKIGSNLYFDEMRMYTAKLDLYSLDIAAEATYVFRNAMAVTLKFGMNIFSLGANIAMPESGRIKDDMFGVVNLIPLLFRPQILFDFGRSVLGVGFLLHSKNFIGYKYVPPNLFYSKDKGIVFNDNFITNYALQIFFRY